MNPSGASAEKDDSAEKYGEAVLDVVVEGEGASNEVQPEKEGPSSDFWKNKLKGFISEHFAPKGDGPSTPIIAMPSDPQLAYHAEKGGEQDKTHTEETLFMETPVAPHSLSVFDEVISFQQKESREKLSRPVKMVIKGSLAYALKMGKDPRLARDVDVYLVSPDVSPEVHIQDFASLEELKTKLDPEKAARVERFLKERGIEDMPIQLVETSESVLDAVKLFDDEPEVVLWDKQLEIFAGGPEATPEMRHRPLFKDVALYTEGRLMRGRMPDAFTPKDGRLSAHLRLVDLGERFGIPVDDEFLRCKEAALKEGALEILIPDEADAKSMADFTLHVEEPYEDSFSNYYGGRKKGRRKFISLANESGVIDVALLNVIFRKGLLPLVETRYPAIADIAKKINSAGGIREYVRTTYGAIYLHARHLPVNAEPLVNLSLPEKTQHELFGLWQSDAFGEVFGSLKEFVDTYVAARGKGVIGEEEDTDTLQLALMKFHTERLMAEGMEDPQRRLKGYHALLEGARMAQVGDLSRRVMYQGFKEEIKKHFFAENDRPLKKMLAHGLANLSRNGDDLSIAADLVDVVRKDAGRIKKEKAERKQVLSPEAIVALRELFELDNADAQKAVFELLANPEIDPRLKKVCLKKLYHGNAFFGFNDNVRNDLKQQSDAIAWEDYGMLYRVENIASKTVRTRVRNTAFSSAARIRMDGRRVHEARKELAPELPAEFFLPLYTMTAGDRDALRAWNTLIGSIKSERLRGGILYSISTMLNADRALLRLITEKIVSAPQVTKEHALLADRLLKKLHFLRTLDEGRRNERGYDAPTSTAENMLKEAKAPSLLEGSIDQALVGGLYDMTGRGDLSADKIQTLFRAWEDPEPVLLYTAELFRHAGDYNGEKNQHAQTLALMGEMLAHMDPPELKEWKEWRYSDEDPVAKEQMKGLSSEAKEAYIADDVVDLGEVLVGLLPSEKPRRIQEEIFHLFRHEPKEGERPKFLRHAPKTFEALVTDSSRDIEGAIRDDLESVGLLMRRVDRWMTLQDDLIVLENLPQQLLHWQNIEVKKHAELQKLGYRGDEDAATLTAEIVRLQQGNEREKAAHLATLKPTTVPSRVNDFLNRHHLPTYATSEEMQRVWRKASDEYEEARQTEEFRLFRERFGKEDLPTRRDFQLAQQELRAGETLLRLARLTPQLIAFNRLVPGKKKLTISKALETLKDHAGGDTEAMGALSRIEGVLAEEHHGVGRDHLAIIFTDHPLALLTVGSYPSGAESCQRYNNGEPALGSYMADASTKMLMLVDLDRLPEEIKQEFESAVSEEEKLRVFHRHPNALLEAMVARRLTKVVRDGASGAPQVFLEPVYTSLDRSSTTRLLNAYAMTRLHSRVGLEIVRGGGSGRVEVAASRNGIQYEDGESGGPGGDGAGIGQMKGKYTMSAQPLTDADCLL